MSYFPRKYDLSLQKALGKAFLDVAPEECVEIVDVLIDKGGRSARVWVNANRSKLARITQLLPRVQGEIERYWQKRYVPKLELISDDGYLRKMDELFEKVNEV